MIGVDGEVRLRDAEEQAYTVLAQKAIETQLEAKEDVDINGRERASVE